MDTTPRRGLAPATAACAGCPADPACRRTPANGGTCADHAPPPPDLPGPFLGLSYRQLDYWTRVGYLRPASPATPGSGTPRTWPDREIVVALLIVRLVNAGLTLAAAARIAREQAANPTGHVRLRGGVRLDLDPAP